LPNLSWKGTCEYFLHTIIKTISGGSLQQFLNPLTSDEEQLLLSEMAAGNHEARQKLVEHNMRLVAHVAKKYYTTSEEAQDLLSIGCIGLMKAVDSYDGSRGYKLATYAARCIENELLMYFREKRKRLKDVSLYESIGQDREGNQILLVDVLEDEEVDVVEDLTRQAYLERMQKYLPRILNEREQEILWKRYGIGNEEARPQRVIAAELGISRSYVSRIEKKALHKLREAMTKEDGFS
jgi:RNA polymerase sporulation-specific sigma factor